MNKRAKKKAEKRKRELIHEMLDVVLDINGLGAREHGITGNKPTAFFCFSGHVGWVEARVYRDGWFSGADADIECRPNAMRTGGLVDAIDKLMAIKADTPAAGTAGESSNY